MHFLGKPQCEATELQQPSGGHHERASGTGAENREQKEGKIRTKWMTRYHTTVLRKPNFEQLLGASGFSAPRMQRGGPLFGPPHHPLRRLLQGINLNRLRRNIPWLILGVLCVGLLLRGLREPTLPTLKREMLPPAPASLAEEAPFVALTMAQVKAQVALAAAAEEAAAAAAAVAVSARAAAGVAAAALASAVNASSGVATPPNHSPDPDVLVVYVALGSALSPSPGDLPAHNINFFLRQVALEHQASSNMVWVVPREVRASPGSYLFSAHLPGRVLEVDASSLSIMSGLTTAMDSLGSVDVVSRNFGAVVVITDGARGPFLPVHIRREAAWYRMFVAQLESIPAGVHLVTPSVRGGETAGRPRQVDASAFAMDTQFGLRIVLGASQQAGVGPYSLSFEAQLWTWIRAGESSHAPPRPRLLPSPPSLRVSSHSVFLLATRVP